MRIILKISVYIFRVVEERLFETNSRIKRKVASLK